MQAGESQCAVSALAELVRMGRIAVVAARDFNIDLRSMGDPFSTLSARQRMPVNLPVAGKFLLVEC